MAIGTWASRFLSARSSTTSRSSRVATEYSLPRPTGSSGCTLGDFGFYYVSLAFLALTTLFVLQPGALAGRARVSGAARLREGGAEQRRQPALLPHPRLHDQRHPSPASPASLNAYITDYVSAEAYRDIWYSVDILVAAVVGGSAALMGPIHRRRLHRAGAVLSRDTRRLRLHPEGRGPDRVLQFAPAGVCDLIARPFRASAPQAVAARPRTMRRQTRPARARGARFQEASTDGQPLRCQNVIVRFGGVVACNKVSLTSRKARSYGLIGPNGAGQDDALQRPHAASRTATRAASTIAVNASIAGGRTRWSDWAWRGRSRTSTCFPSSRRSTTS